MRIYKMTATFGKLEQSILELKPGLNVIEAPNEWGKSTWCAFLLAMLYGLDTRAKSTKAALADKERYVPWSGSPMSGRIDLQWQGRDITIERNTRGRVPMGEFRAYETASGIPVPELTAHTCGQVLLGVEQSVFRRAGFLRLTDLPVTQDDALRRRLNNLVTTGDESGDGERLMQELKELKNRIRYNRTGLLPQAEGERDAVAQKLEELESLETQCRKLKVRLEDCRNQLRALENHRCALAYARSLENAGRLARAKEARDRAEAALSAAEQDCSKLPSRETAEEKLRQLRGLQSQWNAVQEEERQLPPAPEELPQEGPFRGLTGQEALAQAARDAAAYASARNLSGLLVWWISGGLALAGAVALTLLLDGMYGLVALAAGLGFLGIGLAGRKRRLARAARYVEKYGSSHPDHWQALARCHDMLQKNYHQARLEYRHARAGLEERLLQLQKLRESLCGGQSPEKVLEIWKQILKRWETLDHARREYERCEELYQAMDSAVAPVPAPESEDRLTFSEGETELRISDAREEEQRLLGRLGQLQGRMETLGSREVLTARRDALTGRIRRLEETWAAVTLGMETLTQARQELQRRFAPRIAGRAAGLLSELTAGRYDRLTLSQDFALLAGVRQENTLKSILWRSDGTVDQLYLALRLAVAEELTPHAPLILDDALVRFDEPRLKAAMGILRAMAQTKQVILFTCQSRENQLL